MGFAVGRQPNVSPARQSLCESYRSEPSPGGTPNLAQDASPGLGYDQTPSPAGRLNSFPAVSAVSTGLAGSLEVFPGLSPGLSSGVLAGLFRFVVMFTEPAGLGHRFPYIVRAAHFPFLLIWTALSLRYPRTTNSHLPVPLSPDLCRSP